MGESPFGASLLGCRRLSRRHTLRSQITRQDTPELNYFLMGAQLCAEHELKRTWVSYSMLEVLSLFTGAVLVPNLIVCARFTALSDLFRGWINVEFLFLAALYLLLRSRFVLIAIAADLLFDLFEPVAHLYYFSDSDAYRSLRYLDAQPWSRLLLYGTLVLAYIFAIVLVFRILVPKRTGASARSSAAVCALAVLFFAGDFLCGRYQVLGADVTKARLLLVRTPAASFARRVLIATAPSASGSSGRVDSAVARLFNQFQAAIGNTRANVVVVLVESWGEMKEPSVRDRLEGAYQSPELHKRYFVERGLVPFQGATVSGESRELCGQRFSNGIAQASDAQLHGCVPYRFSRAGYATFGVHGFRPGMYGRQDWYPRAGFSNSFFEPELTKAGLKTCPGGLTGTCDADVANWITQYLQNSSTAHPAFIHWVTLNSHLPLQPDISPASRSACAAVSPVLRDEALCTWYSLVARVHESVSHLAMDASVRPAYFVVVGDHAPPFFSTARRDQFSQREVPYVLLAPKSGRKQ
jgi:hypothetical protein